MKHLLILSMAIAGFTAVKAQKKNSSPKVPAATKDAFMKAHPNVSGKWEKEEGSYEVTFKEGGKDMSCVIDKSGTIQETETVIPVSELPAAITASIAQQYKGVKVKEAATISKADGTTLYEAQINGKDIFFDAAGKLIKKKKGND